MSALSAGLPARETWMGDALDQYYAEYRKKVATGAAKGVDWNARPWRKG